MYELATIYAGDDEFVGYAIRKIGLLKLEGSNIYAPSELEDAVRYVAKLNEAQELSKFWPELTDPDVLQLVADPYFAPLEYEDVPVLDWANSEIEYIYVPELERPVYEANKPNEIDKYGRKLENGEPVINYRLSNLVYKTERFPVVNKKSRYQQAQETVARNRMEQINQLKVNP